MAIKENGLPPVGAVGKGSSTNDSVNLHELLVNFKSEDLPSWLPEIYQNPYLTEGSSGIYSLRRQEADNFYTGKKEFILNNFENISIDKISVLFGSPAFSDSPAVKSFWNVFDKMIQGGNPDIKNGNTLYNHSVIWFHSHPVTF
jgi:hypothetical protein